jgi:hypothetical protein
MGIFEQAGRRKLRFGYRGQFSVEDLWDLSVEDLDSIYKKLRASQREMETESLLNKRDSKASVLNLQVGIVKYIVTTKLTEAEAVKVKASNRMRKQKILEIISAKQDQDLESKSVEDLSKLLDELE